MKKGILTALAVSIAVGGLGLSTIASANPRGGKMPSFEEFDTNGDGVITQAEIDAIGEAKFAEFDTNGDGFLDADELKDRMMARGERRRGGGNRGGHGQDGAKGPMGGQGHQGKGHQGQGNQERTQTQQCERMQTQQRERMQTQQRELMQTQQRERMGLAVTHMLQRADTDGDGMLSMDEVRPPQAGRMFERFDADGNGEVTQEEWNAAIAQRGSRNK